MYPLCIPYDGFQDPSTPNSSGWDQMSWCSEPLVNILAMHLRISDRNISVRSSVFTVLSMIDLARHKINVPKIPADLTFLHAPRRAALGHMLEPELLPALHPASVQQPSRGKIQWQHQLSKKKNLYHYEASDKKKNPDRYAILLKATNMEATNYILLLRPSPTQAYGAGKTQYLPILTCNLKTRYR